MGDKFELVTAFSREGPEKVYVQHRLKEYANEINELINQKAYFYTCGDAANMAREVSATLAKIIAEGRGVSEKKGEDVIKSMRGTNQYQVRYKNFPAAGSPSNYLLTNCRRTFGKSPFLDMGVEPKFCVCSPILSQMPVGVIKCLMGGSVGILMVTNA